MALAATEVVLPRAVSPVAVDRRAVAVDLADLTMHRAAADFHPAAAAARLADSAVARPEQPTPAVPVATSVRPFQELLVMTTPSSLKFPRPRSSVTARLRAATMPILTQTARPFTFAPLTPRVASPSTASSARTVPCSTSSTSSATGGSMSTVPWLKTSTQETLKWPLNDNALAVEVAAAAAVEVAEPTMAELAVDLLAAVAAECRASAEAAAASRAASPRHPAGTDRQYRPATHAQPGKQTKTLKSSSPNNSSN